ncbi:hypothetical protein NYE79_03795 [Streptococcus sp. FSL W8-0197]|jgi:hypothetical protein|uniref:hypothetical protein n=1 Tax=Streptococcus TaxID=1301 RepID=UPI001C1EA831|nr:hypothetical protein [Streptococcus oralis]
MNKEDFLKIKDAYKSARLEEKNRIKDFLLSKRDSDGNLIFLKEKDGTNTFVRAGRGYGKKDYSSGRTLSRPYDLSNHMYIDLSYKGNIILISLQSFDIDPNSHNIHVLYDRIGIMFEKDGIILLPDNKSKVSDAFLKMETTNWELPLSEAEMEEMVDYIISHYEK